MATSCTHSSTVDILQLHEGIVPRRPNLKKTRVSNLVGDNEVVRLQTSVYDIEKPTTTNSGAAYQKPGEKPGVTVMYVCS